MEGKHFLGEAAATPPEVRTAAVYEFGKTLPAFRIALSLVQSK